MKLQLRTKLLIGFIAVALIGSAIGAVGIVGINSITDADTVLYSRITVPLAQLIKVTETFQRVRINLRDLNDATTPADRKIYSDTIHQLQAEGAEAAAGFEKTILTDAGRKLYTDYVASSVDYAKDLQNVEDLLAAGKSADAAALIHGKAKQTALNVQATIDALVKSKTDLAQKSSQDNNKLADLMTLVMLVTIFGGFFISIFLAIWLGVYMVSRPLMKISDTLAGGAGQIGGASGQLTAASQDIANGATEQASSIEETSSSMEELSSMVKQNVANAKEASILADKAAESSTLGFGQMEKMLAAMNEISQSSNKIQKVIKVIDDIAFKTNILALNAAVEAARAGEAGMGFAVVADEVKNLANRSADAAKETADMIEDSLKKTAGGLDIATKLAEVFKEILTTAKKVSEMSREVETASTQQDTGIDQVNQAIVQFDEVVQTNASSAEETASAAEELQSQVESLNDMVSQLTLLVTGKTAVITAEVHHHKAPGKAAGRTPGKAGEGPTRKTVHTLPHHTGPKGKSGRSREVSPDQLIPFEDDDDLKE